MKVTTRLLAAMCCLFIAACSKDSKDEPVTPPEPTTVAVTGVSVNKTSLTLVEGSTESVSATVTPDNATNKDVSWKSSDTDVVTVDSNGKLTAVKPGSAVVTVTTVDGEKTATVKIVVNIDEAAAQKSLLMAIFNALGGENWLNNQGWGTDAALADWFGLTVENGKLMGIELANNNLIGELPADIGQTVTITRAEETIALLGDLRMLNLSNNQISGEIPPELANLGALEHLNLNGNEISGNIPPEIGNLSKLNSLDLGANKISGSIPSTIGKLSSLSSLNLSNNSISGNIPPEMGNLSKLESLNLSANSISGEIPAEMGNLTSLTSLDLGSNNISGEIPAEMGNLTNLTNLDLGGNNISGEIPAEMGNLTNLTSLNLGGNEIVGDVPESFSNLENLEHLDISGNNITGIPESVQESDMWKNIGDDVDLTQKDGTEIPTVDPTPDKPDQPDQPVQPDQPDQPVNPEPKPGSTATLPTASLSLNQSELSLKIDDTYQLLASTTNMGENVVIIWRSSNEEVATVDENGNVKAIGIGTAVITAEAGLLTTTCTVTVKTEADPVVIEDFNNNNHGW